MHIYLAIKYHPDALNRPLIEAISAALAAAGHQVTCVARDLEEWGAVSFAPDELMRRSFQAIDRADLVLVELSEKGVGLGIEAGYAHAQGIPIVVVAQRGADISTTLQGIAAQTFFYTDPAEVAALALTDIAERSPRSTWSYVVSSVERLLGCLEEMEAAARIWQPFPTSNSLTVFVTHMIGNIEETVWGVICGQPVDRDRAAEFATQAVDPALLRNKWQTLREQIEQRLATISAADLARLYAHPRRGRMSGNAILIVVARHAAEHLAQAEMVRDLYHWKDH